MAAPKEKKKKGRVFRDIGMLGEFNEENQIAEIVGHETR
jgi:hypothetical protein